MDGEARRPAAAGPQADKDCLPLSTAQREIWREHAVYPGTAVHTVSARIDIVGPLDPALLERALAWAWERHDALRLTPVANDGAPDADGEPMLVEAPRPARLLTLHDMSGAADPQAAADALADALGRRVIALDGQATFRFDLIRVAAARHVWVMGYHHINMDAWANGILTREVAAAYSAFLEGVEPALPPAPSYCAQIEADGAFARSPRHAANRDYWLALYDSPPDRLVEPRAGVLEGGAATGTTLRRIEIDRACLARLRDTAAALNSSPSRLFIAASLILFQAHSGARDIAFGMPVLNRPTARDKETFGLCSLASAPRLVIDPEAGVATLLADLDRAMRGAMRHHRFPLSEVTRRLGLAQRRVVQLFDINISYERVDYGSIAFGAAEGTAPRVLLNGVARTPIEIFVREYGDRGRIEVDLDLSLAVFDDAAADRLARRYVRVLEWLSRGGPGGVSAVPLAAPDERDWLLRGLNDTAADHGPFEPVHRTIERVAAAAPDAEAVRFEGQVLSYAELNGRANLLAQHLRAAGAGPEVRVAVALDRSADLVVALLAVLKAGAAYVPLDPEQPADRLAGMVADAGAPVVVTCGRLRSRLRDMPVCVLTVDGLLPGPAADPDVALGPDHLAYVIYTSGSTGRPKGVMNGHGGLRNRLAWMQSVLPIGAGDRVLQKTPSTFDVSVWEFFWPLMQGATLVVARPDGHRDPDYLLATMRDERISVLHFVPSMLQAFLGHGPSAAGLAACTGLRYVVCSGEALPAALADRFHAHAPAGAGLHNLYGPTEAAIDVSHWPCGFPSADPLPIGHPVANTALYVLNGDLEPVPPGVAGELWIGGVQVARGYLGRPGLTAGSFVADPHSAVPGARMYRTGDLARRRADGALEYLGRRDHQVKLRGQRIELGEIESVLLAHPAVRAAAVLLREDRAGDPRLAGYLVAEGGALPHDLDVHLRRLLPDHMVPPDLMALDALPVTANGKLDRKALPAPAAPAAAAGAPLGPEEEAACAVFAGVLGRESVGPEENFFALGGHSLLAVQAVGRLTAALGVALPANAVLAAPTARALAPRLRAARGTVRRVAPARRPDDPRPASAAEARLWLLQHRSPADNAYNMTGAIELDGATDLPALARAVAAVQARHPILYSRFVPRGDALWLVPDRALAVAPTVEGPLSAAEALTIEQAEAARPFDLSAVPPFRARLLALADGRARLLVAFHHAGVDAHAIAVFGTDLQAAYDHALAGLAPDEIASRLEAPRADALTADETTDADAEAQALARWRTRFAGPPGELDLPRDGAAGDRRALTQVLRIDAGLRRDLARRAVAGGATPFMVLQTALSALLHRLTGQDTIVVGTPVSLRADPALARAVGMLLNSVPLRLVLDGETRLADLLAQARDTVTAALADAAVPLERIVAAVDPERRGEGAPLFQALLTTHPPHLGDLALGGVRAVTRVVPQADAKMDLVVLAADDGETMDITIEGIASRFSPASLGRFAAMLRTMLVAVALEPARQVGAVALLDEVAARAETRGADICDARPAPDGSVADRFRAIAAAHAALVAVEDAQDAGGRALTYRELDGLSDRIARGLAARGVVRGERVGLRMARGVDQIAAMLGVLKAGAAYVPLDLEQPASRLADMADMAGVRVIIADRPDADAVALADLAIGGEDPTGIIAPGGSDTAYVMFTSGSTGRPKGIAIPHRAVLRLAVDPGFAGFRPGKRVAQVATTAFDAATYEIWCALLNGATCVVIGREATYEPEALAAAFRAARVQSTFLTAAVFSRAAKATADAFSGFEEVMFGGEAADPDAVRAALARWPGVRFVNGYGPTETTTFAACHTVAALAPAARTVPIGSAIRATALYVLDEALNPVPRGVAGELYIGGAGLADGYVGEPGQTAGSFLADPFSGLPGARMYRTGDRVRRLPGGALDYLGRMDRQIKLRGFRIEPGEIEAALRRLLPTSAEALVDARATGDDRALYAWIAGTPVDAAEERRLRADLARDLPGWMVPRRIVAIAAVPLSPNGKADRAQLPTPDGDAPADAAGIEPPATATERRLAEIWSALLDGAAIGRRDGFFQAGGHSLLSVRLVAQIREAFGIDLPLGAVFETPVLADLAAAVDRLGAGATEAIAHRARPDDTRPVSATQARLALMDRIDGSAVAYTIPFAALAEGPVDPAAFGRALRALLRRHEPLRTAVGFQGERLTARLLPVEPLQLAVIDAEAGTAEDAAAATAAAAREDARVPFDLAADLPLRARLLRFGGHRTGIVLTLHHIAADGQSMPVLLRDLSALYRAELGGDAELPPLPVCYADWADWSADRRGTAAVADAVQEAAAALAGAPAVLALPTDRPRPPRRTHQGGIAERTIPAGTEQRIERLARRLGATPFAVLAAGYALLLARLSGEDDIVLGVPVAGRDGEETQGLVGFFADTAALRVRLDGDPDAADLIGRVHAALGAALSRPVPFDALVEALDLGRELGHTPVFQAMIAFTSEELPAVAFGDAAARPILVHPATAKFDLQLQILRDGGQLRCGLEYAGDIFDAATAEAIAGRYLRILDWLTQETPGRLSQLSLVTGDERAWLLDGVNATARDYGPFVPVHRRIEAVAGATPDAPAVRFDEATLSYGELNERANALARRLVRAGVGPEMRVGVALERSLDLVVSLLAVLKAGGAYVPLDPELPADRLSYMMADAAVPVVVTRSALLDRLDAVPGSARILTVDGAGRAGGSRGGGNLDLVLQPAGLAYVIYTSGSTGRPKGVMNSHGGLANRLAWMQDALRIGPGDRVLQKTPYTFDVSVWEFFWPLMEGACLVVAPPGAHRDPDALARLMRDERISVLHFVPSMLQAFLGHAPAAAALAGCDALRSVACSGEALSPALVERFLAHAPAGAVLHNLYGPTEAAIDVTHWVCAAPVPDPLPIGHAIANTALYVLDGALEPVPAGVSGELWIGGVQVARGYLGRPGLTAERFVADPHSRVPGDRMYRTGDLARRRPDGALEYLGRIDQQVKLRGFRIELGEIESVLLGHDRVREAAVLLREDRPGDPRLAAYLVCSGGALPEDLDRHLAAQLPDYMIPSDIVVVEALPVTANGKLDRTALPPPEQQGVRADAGAAAGPRSAEEEVACAVFAGVLGRADISVEANFFALGGHSLLALQAVGRLRAALGTDLPANAIFEDPTPRRIADRVKAGRTDGLGAIARRPETDGPIASFGQRQLWFLARMEGSQAYNVPDGFLVDGPLDLAALAGAVSDVAARHEALRSVMPERDGEPLVQVLDPPAATIAVERLDSGDEAAVLAWFRTQALRPFEVGRDMPFRVAAARLPASHPHDGRHAVAIVLHHLATDGASAPVLYRDLSDAYRSRLQGRALQRPEPAVRYYDWAAWQRQRLSGPTLDAMLERVRARLSGAPEGLSLPEDLARNDLQGFRGRMLRVPLPAALAEGLRSRARGASATLFMVLAAGLAAYLSRISGQDDLVIGTPVAGRDRAETEELVGYMVNTVALRYRIAPGDRLADIVERSRREVLDAFADSDLPFDHVVRAVRPARAQGQTPQGRTPLFRVMIVLQPAGRMALDLEGAAVTPVNVDAVSARYDLTFAFDDAGSGAGGGLDLVLHYAEDLFLPDTAARLGQGFLRMLGALAATGAAAEAETVAAVPLLAGDELARETAGPEVADRRRPAAGDIVSRFRLTAAACADRPALDDGRATLSYGELDRLSDRIAGGLAARGVRRGDRVGLALERGIPQVAAMLGILKAGGAYVPLDPEQPGDRLAMMAEAAGPKLVIAGDGARPAVGTAPLVALEALSDAVPAQPALQPGDTAYVMFTSGSTGRPKGIVIPHRAVLRLTLEPGYVSLLPGRRVAQLATTAFDAATFEIWGPLLTGGTCVLLDRTAAYEPAGLAAALARGRIASLFLTTAVFNRAARSDADVFAPLQELFFGGEAVDAEAVRLAVARWPHVRFVHVYGPTETTTFASFHDVAAVPEGARTVPIGRPIRATSLYVLDAALNPVPRGVAGELFIGGAGLADGYVGSPAQTAETFLPDPFADEPGARMYRTGDLVRRGPDGSLIYLGRIDRQIKLRGYRIEPGEIEAAIRTRLDGIEAVFVDARRDAGDSDHALYAWVTGRDLDAAAERDARAALREALPAWMVPRRIVAVPALPINANGKVDARALPTPRDAAAPDREAQAAFETETQQTLAALWRDLLDGAAVGPGDSFFEIGGHSLLGVRLVAAVRERWGVEMPLRTVFEQPGLGAMAAAIDALAGSAAPAAASGIVRRARRQRPGAGAGTGD